MNIQKMLNANRMLCREATYFGSWWTTDRPDWTGPVMRGAVDAGDTAIRWRRRIVRPVVRRSLWSVEKILKNDYIAKDAHTKADRARVASASSTRWWWWSSSLPSLPNIRIIIKAYILKSPLGGLPFTTSGWLGWARRDLQFKLQVHTAIYLVSTWWLLLASWATTRR